jgi:hypothetical protein
MERGGAIAALLLLDHCRTGLLQSSIASGNNHSKLKEDLS